LVSAVDQALPQIDTAAPYPSMVWYLVPGFTVMSAAALGPVLGWLLGGELGGVLGGLLGGDDGPSLGTVPPVQVTPLTAKPAGSGLLPVHEPLKPNETEPLVPIAPL
jgi:hypothetical protein